MAVRSAVLVADFNVEIQRVKWLLLANGDTGEGIETSQYSDRSVQVLGTFGAGGTISLQGSNDGGTTWAILTDPQGNAVTFTSAGIKQIVELTHMIRPTVTAGDGTTSLAMWAAMKKER